MQNNVDGKLYHTDLKSYSKNSQYHLLKVKGKIIANISERERERERERKSIVNYEFGIKGNIIPN